MTATPEVPKVEPDKPTKNPNDFPVLEDMFYLGFTTSNKIKIYDDGKKQINVQFRTLTPTELREVFEATGKFTTFEAQLITEKIETLARSIKTINDMPLIITTKESADFEKEYGRSPTHLEMARLIIVNKLYSVDILDALYEAYHEFVDGIKKNFEDIKKKLKSQNSSD